MVNKKFGHILILFTFILLISCSNDDPSSNLTGRWYGTRYYNNVSGSKWQYLTIDLYDDMTGYLEYESDLSVTIATFEWKTSGGYVLCNGISGNSYGEASDQFSMKMQISGDRLIPIDIFNLFILTKDNSVITDGEGNEITEESGGYSENNTSTSGAIIDGLTRSDIETIIKSKVSVTATYSDYLWHFHVESTLANTFPNHTIKYGIGHGNVNGNTNVSIGAQAYKYSSYNSGDKQIIDFYNPFWFYYIFGASTVDKDTYSLCEIYYSSYIALKNKGYSSLTSDEKSLYSDLVSALNKYESATKYAYTPSVQILIDDEYSFVVGTYSR